MRQIFSALEPCDTYKPWHDKSTHHTYLRRDTSKCLHYYFYFMDPDPGVMLSARGNLVSLSLAVLFQRTCVVSRSVVPERNRL